MKKSKDNAEDKLEKLEAIANGLAADKSRKSEIAKEYVEKEKIKKLTTDERLTRIERMLKIV